jgi:hypothetical protein
MKYHEPTIHPIGDVQKLVRGTKYSLPFTETPDGQYWQSLNAYEADE